MIIKYYPYLKEKLVRTNYGKIIYNLIYYLLSTLRYNNS